MLRPRNRAILLEEFLAAPNSANVCLPIPPGPMGVASDYAPPDLILDFLGKLLTVALRGYSGEAAIY
jgi:hypothetical protein